MDGDVTMPAGPVALAPGAVCHVGDCRASLASMAAGSVRMIVTSTPYWGMREYGGGDAEIGRETTPAEFVGALVGVFREARRVLADDGTLWLNIDDSRANDSKWGGASGGKHAKALHGQTGIGRGRRTTGLADGNLCGIPWRLALALQDDGWILRSDIVWSQPNPFPESVTDRPTRAHEYLFLLSKGRRYFYDADAIREPMVRGSAGSRFDTGKTAVAGAGRVSSLPREDNPDGRNARDVWTIPTESFDGAHFATMPTALARRCIRAGSRRGDVVLDPFGGAATTALVALQEHRRAVLCELNPAYVDLQRARLADFDGDAVSPVRVEAPAWGDLFSRGAR